MSAPVSFPKEPHALRRSSATPASCGASRFSSAKSWATIACPCTSSRSPRGRCGFTSASRPTIASRCSPWVRNSADLQVRWSRDMKTSHLAAVGLTAIGIAGAIDLVRLKADMTYVVQTRDAVAIDADDIGGVVSGPKGPEAGVWVIAETNDLPTKFARIVVTDDRGRYVLPDLPKASYRVWVRGYGLVGSPKAQA